MKKAHQLLPVGPFTNQDVSGHKGVIPAEDIRGLHLDLGFRVTRFSYLMASKKPPDPFPVSRLKVAYAQSKLTGRLVRLSLSRFAGDYACTCHNCSRTSLNGVLIVVKQ